MDKSADVSIGVTACKARSLALIDDIATGKTGRILLMKHNRATIETRPAA